MFYALRFIIRTLVLRLTRLFLVNPSRHLSLIIAHDNLFNKNFILGHHYV